MPSDGTATQSTSPTPWWNLGCSIGTQHTVSWYTTGRIIATTRPERPSNATASNLLSIREKPQTRRPCPGHVRTFPEKSGHFRKCPACQSQSQSQSQSRGQSQRGAISQPANCWTRLFWPGTRCPRTSPPRSGSRDPKPSSKDGEQSRGPPNPVNISRSLTESSR